MSSKRDNPLQGWVWELSETERKALEAAVTREMHARIDGDLDPAARRPSVGKVVTGILERHAEQLGAALVAGAWTVATDSLWFYPPNNGAFGGGDLPFVVLELEDIRRAFREEAAAVREADPGAYRAERLDGVRHLREAFCEGCDLLEAALRATKNPGP